MAAGGPVVPVYVWDEAAEDDWVPGPPSRWWLHHSLAALDASLRARGSRLVVARGNTARALAAIADEVGAGAVCWNRHYEPAAREQEAKVAAALAKRGIEPRSFPGALLHEPLSVANRQGRPFQVFSPFWRHCLGLAVTAPAKFTAKEISPPAEWPPSLALDELKLLRGVARAGQLAALWQPGEESAGRRLRRFALHALERYADERDLPAVDGTSTLSPHLHHGEITPRQVWAAVRARSGQSGVFPPNRGATVFLTELGWREFAHHLLFHFPTTPERPLRAEFARFKWASDPRAVKLRAWERGETGYPIVDAGMRQLAATGWMHNRVRMIVASFFVKHLRLPWRQGAAWFWHSLVDADLANNTLGWQWSAGCGADAAPFFRIFAPVVQGRRFDPEGDYVRRWVPELARLPAPHIHAPWEAPPALLREAEVTLGENYPRPIVDHAKARADALAAFHAMRSTAP